MESNTHTSDVEAERAGSKESDRKVLFLNPTTLKRAFQVLGIGLKVWRVAAKLWEWFL